MSTLGERTLKKYRGKMASGYEAKRKKQERWAIENETVETWLTQIKPGMVLDVPVGTGRFLDLYRKIDAEVCGLDSSSEMLDLAADKLNKMKKKSEVLIHKADGTQHYTMGSKKKILLEQVDARDLSSYRTDYDAVVCIRFLDLVDEDTMRKVMKQMMLRTQKYIVLTIRLGSKYVCKVNTATHDAKKFKSMISKAGFKITRDVPVFNEGWHILQMERGA